MPGANLSNLPAGLTAGLPNDSCEFRLWAPAAHSVTLRLTGRHGTRDWPMHAEDEHFVLHIPARAGDRRGWPAGCRRTGTCATSPSRTCGPLGRSGGCWP